MASIKKTVALDLSDEEKEILRKASQIIEDLIEEDGADLVYDMCDNYNDGLWFISAFLDKMIEISD